MRLLKFFDFIFESKSQIKVPFVSSNKFLDLIGKINSPIADEIFKIQYMPSDLSLIRLGESDEMISFTSALKILTIFQKKNLQASKNGIPATREVT